MMLGYGLKLVLKSSLANRRRRPLRNVLVLAIAVRVSLAADTGFGTSGALRAPALMRGPVHAGGRRPLQRAR